jgi:hypothetical protein
MTYQYRHKEVGSIVNEKISARLLNQNERIEDDYVRFPEKRRGF